MSDAPEFERITYRVEWVFMIGSIGDSEGRTWAKELIEEKRFATKLEAEAYRDTHPDLELSQWGSWKTKHSYGQFAIVRQEVRTDPILDPLDDPRVKALVDAATEVGRISDRDHVAWRRLSAALDALNGGTSGKD